MIVIVDYGMGNLHSVQSKIESLKYEAIISSRVEDIENASKLILPGVGSFARGIENIREYGLLEILNKKALLDKTPILGICLGMQLLTNFSEEGDAEGLSWVEGETRKFTFGNGEAKLRIPHVGWNTTSVRKKSVLFDNIPDNKRYYFTHSYYVACKGDETLVATTNYGYEFASVVQKDNIYGTQFHPEKSHQHGLQMIDNFLKHG